MKPDVMMKEKISLLACSGVRISKATLDAAYETEIRSNDDYNTPRFNVYIVLDTAAGESIPLLRGKHTGKEFWTAIDLLCAQKDNLKEIVGGCTGTPSLHIPCSINSSAHIWIDRGNCFLNVNKAKFWARHMDITSSMSSDFTESMKRLLDADLLQKALDLGIVVEANRWSTHVLGDFVKYEKVKADGAIYTFCYIDAHINFVKSVVYLLKDGELVDIASPEFDLALNKLTLLKSF